MSGHQEKRYDQKKLETGDTVGRDKSPIKETYVYEEKCIKETYKRDL